MMKTILLDANNITGRELKVAEDTQFIIINSGKKTKPDFDLRIVFEKPGLSAEILGIFILGKNEEVKIATLTKHLAPNTSCNTFIRAVLSDNSSFDCRGKIFIGKNAVRTNAFLHDHVLVAGDNTRRNSQPTLEIETNDVKASHGSTTGRIDESQLYYLKSRGLLESEAKDLIKEGFLAVLTDRIKDKKIREIVLNKLKSKRESL